MRKIFPYPRQSPNFPRLTAWRRAANRSAVRPLLRIFSLLTLLGWLFAAGHVASEHAGVADGGARHAMLGCEDGADHDDHGPEHDGEHHQHHDLTALGAGPRLKSVEDRALAPVWMLPSEVLSALLADMFAERCETRLPETRDGSPPDERAFGWLLDCTTARPVRGPSVVV